MIFGDKNSVGPEKGFTCADLFQYVEKVLKLTTQHDRNYGRTSNYSWLKARELQLHDPTIARHLEDLRPMINKMTSEDSAAIAVKLDRLTEEQHFNLSDLLAVIKKLLLEQDNTSLMEKNVKRVKERKNRKIINKVRPELVGREATVSFIVESDSCIVKDTPYCTF